MERETVFSNILAHGVDSGYGKRQGSVSARVLMEGFWRVRGSCHLPTLGLMTAFGGTYQYSSNMERY
jgi:hypothetical protein